MAKARSESNSLGIAGFILGIINIIFFWIPILGIAMGILSIVLAVRQKRIYPNGIATAGLILGIISLAFGALFFVLYVWALAID